MELQACKDGETQWKMLILPCLTWAAASRSSAFMMAMEVIKLFSMLPHLCLISWQIFQLLILIIGNEVADFVRDHLIDELKKLPSFKAGNYEEALKDINIRIDNMLQTPQGKSKLQSYKKNNDSGPSLFNRGSDDIAMGTGCTATCALITPTDIIVANAGDSRVVLGVKKGGAGRYVAVDMSIDHKPDNREEKKRIEHAGGFVEDNRVKGVLALSRSIGDLEYKLDKSLSDAEQMITAVPEIQKEKISNETAFLILACDGIWDCMSSQECVSYIGDLLPQKKKISETIESLFDRIIA